ncbi:MAG TPA: DUF1801 domain-containing protein [Chitinophagaceae bacterium]|nr:DUF1801 domain-containing protein [Chitinophagaceae bacterium]
MAKVKAKTTETTNSVSSFVKKIEDKQRQKDCFAIIDIMKKQSSLEPKMWGPAIIGFGSYHYKYESGHEGDAPLVGFSPRKSEFALYIANFDGKEALLKNFGKHKTAKACVYIKKLEDINVEVLKKMITGSIKHYQAKYK